MTTPHVCPQPGPRNPGPDCPLFEVAEFRRKVRAESDGRCDRAALIAGEVSRPVERPAVLPTRPLPKPDPLALGQAAAGEPLAVPATKQKGGSHA